MGRQKPQKKTTQKQQQPEESKTLPLPKEVREASANGDRCSNIGLWLDRFLTVNKQTWELTKDAKERGRVLQLASQQKMGEHVSADVVNALQERYNAMLEWYKQRGFLVKRFEAKPVWRFVVGLGAAHVLETGITLHRLFGLPIIPGSALKGAARAYAELVEGKKDKTDPELIAIFGTTEQAGSVIFFDAVPVKLPKFELDIMNPHFPNYYQTQGKNPPADWESPKPVFFLTVSERTYLFAIAARTKDANALLDTAERWLKGALSELGIGAKTSADYGYFEIVDKSE